MSKGQKILKNGRSGPPLFKSSFLKMTLDVYQALDERRVSAVARAVLFAMLSRYNGHNNGRIGFACRAGEPLGISPQTTMRALHELIAKGFIAVVTLSAFTLKTRKAAEYRLTFKEVVDRKATFWDRPFVAVGNLNNSSTTGTENEFTVPPQVQPVSEIRLTVPPQVQIDPKTPSLCTPDGTHITTIYPAVPCPPLSTPPNPDGVITQPVAVLSGPTIQSTVVPYKKRS
jgi:hypothetical protein